MTYSTTNDRLAREDRAFDPPLEDYPAVLRITSVSEQEVQTRALDRGTKQVYADTHLLAEYGIVHFEDGTGQARMPRVPYDTIKIELEISTTSEHSTENATADA